MWGPFTKEQYWYDLLTGPVLVAVDCSQSLMGTIDDFRPSSLANG